MKEFNEEFLEKIRHIVDTNDDVQARAILNDLHRPTLQSCLRNLT